MGRILQRHKRCLLQATKESPALEMNKFERPLERLAVMRERGKKQNESDFYSSQSDLTYIEPMQSLKVWFTISSIAHHFPLTLAVDYNPRS